MKRGFIAGNFDVIHPGYIMMFQECNENCDHFTVLLHSDPSIERPNKLKPILSTQERIQILKSVYEEEFQRAMSEDANSTPLKLTPNISYLRY